MAVSHQWYIQWSSPPIVVADITKEYDKIDQWNEPVWDSFKQDGLRGMKTSKSPTQVNNAQVNPNVFRPSVPVLNNAGYEEPNVYQNGNTRVAALTLWLTTLGMTRAQSLPADTDTPPFSTLYKWKRIDFEFPSPRHRRHALATRKYVPTNVSPLGVEVWGSRVWVTLPNWRGGVPATLATVPRAGGLTSPLLKPYPSWGYHNTFGEAQNCSGLISVFRINADSCGRLWVLDSGQINAQTEPKQVCPPNIAVFNMWNDKLIARFIIPKKYVLEGSLFSNIIVDTRTEDCSDLHAYIADTWRFSLVVFRLSDQKFWRFTHHLFFPDPLASNYTLHELNFQWTDGLIGLALSPIIKSQPRTLYFNSMSSYREFSVSTSVLQDESRVNNSATEFRIVGKSRGSSGHASAASMDRRGVLFYGLVTRDSVGCWDSKKPHCKDWLGVAAQNSENLVFPNDLKVDQDIRQSVWVVTNRLPYFQAMRLNQDDYNFRILYADAEEAVRGTVCDPDLKRRHKSLLERDLYLV